MLRRSLIALSLIVLFFVGCQQAPKTSATLQGQLFVRDPDNAMPAADNAIYLVPLTSDEMVLTVPTIDFDTAIQAKVENATGKFTFSKVVPGKYLMMVVTIYDTQIPAYTEDGSLAVIEVKDTDLGKTIDLKYFVVP
jgi:hypothetical protein